MPSKKSSDKSKTSGKLPTKEDIIAFIESSTDKVGKREIARAFHIKGAQRKDLKVLLGQMAEEGLITGNRKGFEQPGKLPAVTVLDIVGLDADGETYAKPLHWNIAEYGEAPRVLIRNKSGRKKNSSSDIPGIGERVLARISPTKSLDQDGYPYSGTVIKKIVKNSRSLLGIYRSVDEGGLIAPIEKKQLREWPVAKGDEAEASDGELVRFEVIRAGRFGYAKAKVTECLGNPDDQRAISLIAIHSHGIRDHFPDPVILETEQLKEFRFDNREDLRDIPLITIDPEDARDHDDAVWATKDDDPNNPDGWLVIVAIADVACYVRPGSELDVEARKRGNSTYFPDRVVPMLPERISNNLCSLRHGEDRPCLAVKITFDKEGHKKRHRFVRGVMRSAAKLSYQQAQAAIDGKPDDTAQPLLDTVLRPLWEAYHQTQKARAKRAPLELDLPERKITLNEKGQVKEIRIPERLDAHKLIEEFMIQANVCAAEELEKKQSPFVYRVHDSPSDEKITSLADFLSTLDIKIPKGNLRPEHFNRILNQTRESAVSHVVTEVVLRSQSQAEYTPINAGHFGLNLRRYAHFTSPIRRYADLIVHRSLIRALGLGKDGITDVEIEELDDISKEISDLERKSMAAERDTIDRLISSHLAEHIGSRFHGRISGVTRSGLFVRLEDTGADGFIPVSTMDDDYYIFDEGQKKLFGERKNLSYSLGDQVEVLLVEAVPTAGAIRFEVISPGKKQQGPKPRKSGSRRNTTFRRAGRKR